MCQVRVWLTRIDLQRKISDRNTFVETLPQVEVWGNEKLKCGHKRVLTSGRLFLRYFEFKIHWKFTETKQIDFEQTLIWFLRSNHRSRQIFCLFLFIENFSRATICRFCNCLFSINIAQNKEIPFSFRHRRTETWQRGAFAFPFAGLSCSDCFFLSDMISAGNNWKYSLF